MSEEFYTKFVTDEGETLYRPTVDYAGDLKHDRLAFCASCTEVHEDIGPNFAFAFCPSCKQHKVFGHMHFDQII